MRHYLYALALCACLATSASAQPIEQLQAQADSILSAQLCPDGVPLAADISEVKDHMREAGDVLILGEDLAPSDMRIKSALRAYSSAWALTQTLEIIANMARRDGGPLTEIQMTVAAERASLEFYVNADYVREASVGGNYGDRMFAAFVGLGASMRRMGNIMHACYTLSESGE